MKDKKIIKVENSEEIKVKRNVITIESNGKLLEFKYPNKLTYKNVLDKLKNDDTASSFEILFDDCLNQLDNNFEFEDKIGYFEELASKFLSFKEFSFDERDGLFIVVINNKELKFKKPDREQIKQLFNVNLKSSTESLNYIYSNLKVSGYEFNFYEIEDIVDFYSLHQLPSMFIYHKQLDLKKK